MTALFSSLSQCSEASRIRRCDSDNIECAIAAHIARFEIHRCPREELRRNKRAVSLPLQLLSAKTVVHHDAQFSIGNKALRDFEHGLVGIDESSYEPQLTPTR